MNNGKNLFIRNGYNDNDKFETRTKRKARQKRSRTNENRKDLIKMHQRFIIPNLPLSFHESEQKRNKKQHRYPKVNNHFDLMNNNNFMKDGNNSIGDDLDCLYYWNDSYSDTNGK